MMFMLLYYLVIILWLKSSSTFCYAQNYKGCHEIPQLTLWLSKTGHCLDTHHCKYLRNCTTLYGDLIVRSTFNDQNEKQENLLKPYFPQLKEITGFLAITFYNQPVFDILPGLAVIRGSNLIGNYAFVVYFNELKNMYFSQLTTILHGGVRIDRNTKLCYAETVRWKSLVKDKDQEERFGIVLESNNLNCDSSCVSNECYAASGHSDDPNAQYCWGPGIANIDFQCQKFCNRNCSLSGCLQDTISECCHKECLGGCASINAFSCNACKHYRVEETGECVAQCPTNFSLVNNLVCKRECPIISDKDGIIKKEYLLDGRCVKECPARYLKNDTTFTCSKCVNPLDCPRVCILDNDRTGAIPYRGVIIRIPSDILEKNLIGCTEIRGSLTFQIQEGTGNVEMFSEGLKWIRIVRGHIKVHKSSLKTLSFFKNLEIIDPLPSDLLHNSYAILIYDNQHLERLWTPLQKIKVTRGKIFAQSNPRLCPQEIYSLQDKMYQKNGNVSGDISEQSNGNRVVCQVQRLEMTVEEVFLDDPFSFDSNIPLSCFYEKCVTVNWEFTRDGSSYYILFYSIYYLKLGKNELADKQVVGDFNDNDQWQTKDVEKPKPDKTGYKFFMKTVIESLTPHARYAFYIKEVVSKGEGKTSRINYLHITQDIPSAPLGLEASFLSESAIHLQWKAPDKPNGVIVSYQIYWQQASYSFWRDQKSLDWCRRDVKAGVLQKKTIKEVVADGQCVRNITCSCDEEKEKSVAVNADREAAKFVTEFQERINKVIFRKQKSKDDFFGEKIDVIPTTGGSLMTTRTTTTTDKPIVFKLPNGNVSGDVYSFTVENLNYFQDYVIRVCACTEVGERGGGCATPEAGIASPCASAQARTAINTVADNLQGDISVTVKETTYNITWEPPLSPNAIVLKYDVAIKYDETNDEVTICHPGNMPAYLSRSSRPGVYTAKVRAISPAGNGSWSSIVSFTIEDKSVVKNTMLILGVSIGAVVFILILLVFLVYYALFKRRNDKEGAPGVLYASVNPEYMQSSEIYLPDDWELDREKIELLRELGQGSFGMVYEGIAHEIPGATELRVAVKTVNENASIRDRIEFLQEASIMKAFDSNHVVKLIGVVSQGQPTFVVMELMGRGDLKSFLRGRRPEENSNLLPPLRQEMLQMAAEIADGMAYLAARKFVHRDLAARNCMVAIDFTVKIGDFGMARDIYETNYYRKGGKGLLPVRWMAPESLRDGIFTTASDVWSFGVVLWEIVTLAAQPYQGKSNEEVLHFVLNDGQLIYPDDCDKQMKEFMELCWQRDPKLRPSFLEIIRLLDDDVSEDFIACSFYYEMKRKALEDTLCQESNLLELLSRPHSRVKADGSFKRRHLSMSSSSVDSGAFIENSKPESDQTPEISVRKSLVVENDYSLDKVDIQPPLEPSNVSRNCKSVYDNYGTIGDNMRYGDTPVKVNNKSGNLDGEEKQLKLSSIFIGKPVAV